MAKGAANERSMQSTLDTGDDIVRTGPCYWWGMMINTDGTNDGTVVVYDGLSTGGIKIFDMTALGADESYGIILPRGIWCGEGIYVDLTGTNAECWTFWELAS